MARPPTRRIGVDPPCQTCYALAEVILEFEAATPLELAGAIQLHVGNVRKHLLHLAGKNLASRQPGRTWSLTPKGVEWIGDHLTGVDTHSPPENPDRSDSDEEVSTPG